jgi:beta-1,4-mannosyltransferase
VIRVLAWPEGRDDDLNPYVRRMYGAFVPPAASILAFRPLMRRVPDADILHIHWPEGIFEGAGGDRRLIVALKALRVLGVAKRIRQRGGKVVVTAHNAAPHRALTGWRRMIWQSYHARLLQQVDHIIGLSADSLDSYRAANPIIEAVPSTIIAHPHYRKDYPIVEQGIARDAWNIPVDRWVLGMVGSLRGSKNLVEAANTFLAIRRSDECLLIAGAAGDNLIGERLAHMAAGSEGAIRLVVGGLDDARFASAIAACDACLINQTTTLNSGTALVTLSLDRALIAPSVGTLPSLAAELGTRWVSLFEPPLTKPNLRASIDALRSTDREGRPNLDHLDPDALSRAMLACFSSLLAN